jgi:hypothetical protein
MKFPNIKNLKDSSVTCSTAVTQHILKSLQYNIMDMHLVMILGKWPTWRTVLFYIFISILYMFRATPCSSSGESIILCAGRKGSSFPTCTRNGHWHRMTYTRGCIDTIDSPDDECEVSWNM